ncbi:DUF6233 domain-containing protein [Streptomyces sp. NPDC052415]|uniref:DUF6233 domain-containing protein n=1 Tax=Streptomyces sp. NPDC052415 TaxID=3365690 RepID=UPI0037D49AD6
MDRIDARFAALRQRQAEEARGRQGRPAPPDWVVELGIGSSRQPVEVHVGDCHMTGKRRRAISRDEARRLLATGLRACLHCQPDTQLGIIDKPQQRPVRGCRCRRTAGERALLRESRHQGSKGGETPSVRPPSSGAQSELLCHFGRYSRCQGDRYSPPRTGRVMSTPTPPPPISEPDPSALTCPGDRVGLCAACQRKTHRYGTGGSPLSLGRGRVWRDVG